MLMTLHPLSHHALSAIENFMFYDMLIMIVTKNHLFIRG